MKHLLVPIDFSNDSLNALEFAIILANRMKLGIRLIHVKRKNADYNPSFNLKDFDVWLYNSLVSTSSILSFDGCSSVSNKFR